jgi:tetratricopeptide (TPR) repeat protein
MPYDLFISYAHADNVRGQVRELSDAIQDDFRRFAGRELEIFFDESAIPSMSDWESRIGQGLRESRLFLAVLSPNYFASAYCRRELDEYVRYEAMRQCIGEGVAPVYFVELPALLGEPVAPDVASAIAEMRKRQWCDLVSQSPVAIVPWHEAGRRALEDAEVARRLASLKQQLAERLTRADRARASATNIYRHNPQFVGRIRELTLLREALNERGSVGVVGHRAAAVHGLGGMGKTELALAYAHAFAWDYPGGRWLMRCEGLEDIDLALRQLAEPLQVALTEDEQRDSRLAADRILSELGRRDRSLLLLDNVTHPALIGPDVLMRLPPQSHVHMLATTRLGPTQLGGSPHDHTFVAVDELPPDDALALIRSHQPSGRFETPDEEAAARDLVVLLSGFVLAVETAAIFLGRHAAPAAIGEYVTRLRRELLAESEAAATDPAVAVRHKEKLLQRTLDRTFATLSEPEIEFLTLGALLPADQIPLPWLRAAAGIREGTSASGPAAADGSQRVSESLLSLRLFQPTAAVDERQYPLVVRMHRMVQALVVQHVRPNHAQEDEALTGHAIRRGNILFETWSDPRSRWEIDPLVATAALWMSRGEARGTRLASAAQWPLQSLARWPEAEALLRQAVATETHLGEGRRELATALNNLARLLEATHRHEEAETLYRRAIAIDKTTRSDLDPKAANHLNNLGELKRKDGDYSEAERLFREALAINEVVFGSRHISVARGLNNLGLLLANTGRHAEAEPLLRRAIDSYTDVVGPDHPDLAAALNNLGYLYQNQKRDSEAELLFRRALEILEASLGDRHPQVATCLTNIAVSLQNMGRLSDAEPLLRRALEIDEASYGADHEEVAVDLNNLGIHLFLQRRLPEAESCLRRRLGILLRRAVGAPRLQNQVRESIRVYGALLAKMGLTDAEVQRRIHAVVQESQA